MDKIYAHPTQSGHFVFERDSIVLALPKGWLVSASNGRVVLNSERDTAVGRRIEARVGQVDVSGAVPSTDADTVAAIYPLVTGNYQ